MASLKVSFKIPLSDETVSLLEQLEDPTYVQDLVNRVAKEALESKVRKYSGLSGWQNADRMVFSLASEVQREEALAR